MADKWIEIDINSVQHNLCLVQSLLNQGSRLIAVVKGNAYGHGAGIMANILAERGVDFFAVTFLEEAIELRRAGIQGNILVFSPVVEQEEISRALEEKITLTISSLYDGKLIDNVSRSTKLSATVHLKIDTGLGRFGLSLKETLQTCYSLRQNPGIYIEGIYTHFSESAAKRSNYTRDQFNLFMEAVNVLRKKGFTFPLRHCANSAAVLKYPEMHLDAVRVGTLLYGQLPVGTFAFKGRLAETFKLKAQIISIKTKSKGDFLGYYRNYRLKKSAKIVVIPVGYMDGMILEIANRPMGLLDLLKIIAKRVAAYFGVTRFQTTILINGQPFPVRGKVFMQLALVEIPDNIEACIGDEVEVPIKKILANPKIERVYINSKGKQSI